MSAPSQQQKENTDHGDGCKETSDCAASVYSNSSSLSPLDAEKRQAAAEYAAKQQQQSKGGHGSVSLTSRPYILCHPQDAKRYHRM